jgi:hypothetical protein
MFVLCELHSKDKRDSQDNQDKGSSTDEVQRTKKIPNALTGNFFLSY